MVRVVSVKRKPTKKKPSAKPVSISAARLKKLREELRGQIVRDLQFKDMVKLEGLTAVFKQTAEEAKQKFEARMKEIDADVGQHVADKVWAHFDRRMSDELRAHLEQTVVKEPWFTQVIARAVGGPTPRWWEFWK